MYNDTRPKLVDIYETRRQLSIGRTGVYQLIDAGELTRVKIGSRALITQASIDQYIDRLTAEATA